MGHAPTAKIKTNLTGSSFCLYGTWQWRPLDGILLARWYIIHGPYPKISIQPTGTQKTKRCNQKMNANVKDFEAELLAQAEDALRRTTQLSPEAEVVTATAL
jgi:hypothetical protein